MHTDYYTPIILPKNRLVHGHYYAGKCRNANIARWDATKERFVHWRFKYGRNMVDDIEYWDLHGIYDGFIPLFDLGEEPPQAIPLDAD